MEAVIKINIPSSEEEDYIPFKYAKGRLRNVTDEDLKELIYDIIAEAIIENGVYFDTEDAELALEEMFPIITDIILNERFSHIRMHYNKFVELITYLTVRLA